MNKCRDCLYFRRQIDMQDVSKHQGNCLFLPPRPFPMVQQQGLAVVNIRPQVDGDDFCSNHKIDAANSRQLPPPNSKKN